MFDSILLLFALHASVARVDAPAPPEVRGAFVEARTASVFAGACHYGAEATTGGREAVVAWRFDSGSHLGVNLAGVEVAAAIAGEANLAQAGCPRRSILYFSDRTTSAERDAARDLLRGAFGSVLGETIEERAVPLRFRIEGESYEVAAGDVLEISGNLLPDRACCKMPYQVWYRPLAGSPGAIVGCNALFRCTEAKLGAVWRRCEENGAFVGSFSIPEGSRDRSR